MYIRRFTPADAAAASDMAIHTVNISNAKDYTPEQMDEFLKILTPEELIKKASWTHMYVACDDDEIIGCGAIGPYWGKEDESCLFVIFVLPEKQGSGIGRAIINALESDEYALRARCIRVSGSATALGFYQKMGYVLKEGSDSPDEEGLYSLEKYR